MAEKFVLTAQLNLQAPTNVKQVLSSMKNDLKSVSVDIDVKKGAQAVKKLNEVAKATKEVESNAKKASTGADQMGRAFGGALKNVLKYDLARRVFSAFTNTIEQGLQDAIRFEREMIKIAQVSGATTKELKGLERTVTKLSTSLGVSSSSLVRVGLILKQTGLGIKDTQRAMEALAKTELAPTFDNITNTAETAIAAMRQFKIEASGLEGLLSKINSVAANFAVEASDIGVAIKRTGGAFKAAGGQVEELIALFTSVRSTTRETAETIATGFRTIFTRMQRPTTIKFLRQFGIELTDLNGKFVGPFEAVKRLSSALQGLESTDLRFSAIVEQLGGFRQVSKVIPLIKEFSTAQDAMNAQLAGTGSLAKDAEMAQASLAIQLIKLSENVKELFREIAGSTAFKEMAKFALMAANAAVTLAKALAPIIPLITAMMAFKAVKWGGGKMFGGGGIKNAMFGGGSGGGSGGGMGMGFSGGGRVRRFSGGGWVPGSGNGDTVPAMLQPGEFVLRKSAAQAYGSQLNGMNGYAKGGKTVSVKGQTLRGFSKVGAMINEPGKRRWTHRTTKPDGSQNPWGKSAPSDQFNPGDRFSVLNEHLNIPMHQKHLKTLSDSDRSALMTFSGISAGKAWEKVLKSSGTMTKTGGSSPALDGMVGTTVGDAAISSSAHTPAGIAGKYFRHMALGKNKAGFLGGFATTHKSDKLDMPGVVTEFLPNKDQIKGELRTILNQQKNNKKLATHMPGSRSKPPAAKAFASGGEVPSLLTPGEFVVNKQSAQSFGYGNLRKMNKYAGGGTVRRYASGTGGTGVTSGGSMGMGGGMMMPMMMSNMMDSTGKATKGIYGMGEGAMGAYFKMNMFSAGLDMGMDAMGQTEGGLRDFTDVIMKAAVVLGTIKGATGAGGGAGMLSKAADVGMAASMFQGGGIKGAATRMGGKTLARGAQGIKGIATKGLFWKQVAKREAIATKGAKRVVALEKLKVVATRQQAAAEKNLERLIKKRTKQQLKLAGKQAAGKTARTAELLAKSQVTKFEDLAKSTTAAKNAEKFRVGNKVDGWKMPKFQRNIDPRYGHEATRARGSLGVAAKEQALQGSKAAAAEKSSKGLGKGIAETEKAILTQKKALEKSTRTIAASSKKIPMLTKMGKAAKTAATALKAFTVVALVAEIAVGMYGKAMAKRAHKDLKEQGKYEGLADDGLTDKEAASARKGITTGRTISGAATGAGIGAAIGSIIMPGVGTAVGAILGGSAGGIYSWMNAVEEAEKSIQLTRFTHASDRMADAMDMFSKKQLTSAATMDEVMRAHREMIANAGGVGVLGATEGAAKSETAMHTLAREFGKESTSVEQFDRKVSLNQGLQEGLDTGLVKREFLDTIREETAARIESQERLEAYVDAQNEAIKELASLRQLGNIFDEVGNRVKRFGNIVNAIADPTGGISLGGGMEENLALSGSRDPESIKRFEDAVDRMGNIAGEAGETGLAQGGMKGRVKDSAFMERNMGNVLQIASGSNAIGDDFRSEIQNQLEAAADLEGYTISEDMQKHFDTVLMNMDVIDLKDASKMDENIGKFTEAHAEFVETYRKAAKVFDDHQKNLLGMYAASNKVESQQLAKRQEIITAQYRAEQNYLKQTQSPGVDFMTDQGAVDAQFNRRQMADLAGVGDLGGGKKGTDLAGDVGGIGKAYRQVSKQLIQSNREIQEQGLKGIKPGGMNSALTKDADAQIKANAKLRKQYELLGGVLDKYKNTQERLIAINEKMAQEQKLQETLEDLAFNLTYGTAEEKEDSAYLVNQIEKARAAGKVRGVVDPEMERTVAKFLKTSGMDGGQEAISNEISATLHEAGAAFTSAVGNAFAGITAPSEKMLELAKQKLELEKEAILAMQAEEGEIGDRGASIKSAIIEANDKFITDLRDLMMGEKTRELDQEMKVNEKQIQANQELLAYLDTLGLDPNDPLVATKLQTLQNAGEQQAEGERLNKAISGQLDVKGISSNVEDIRGGAGVGFNNLTMEDAMDEIANKQASLLQASKYEQKFGTEALEAANPMAKASSGLLKVVRMINNLEKGEAVNLQHLQKVESMVAESGFTGAFGSNQALVDANTDTTRQWFGTTGMSGRQAMSSGPDAWKEGSGGFIQNMKKQFGELYVDDKGESTFYRDMDGIIKSLASTLGGVENIKPEMLFAAITKDVEGRQQAGKNMIKASQDQMKKMGMTEEQLDIFLKMPPEIRKLLVNADMKKLAQDQIDAINETNRLIQLKADITGKERGELLDPEKVEEYGKKQAQFKVVEAEEQGKLDKRKKHQATQERILAEEEEIYTGTKRGIKGTGGERFQVGDTADQFKKDISEERLATHKLVTEWKKLAKGMQRVGTDEQKETFSMAPEKLGRLKTKFEDRFAEGGMSADWARRDRSGEGMITKDGEMLDPEALKQEIVAMRKIFIANREKNISNEEKALNDLKENHKKQLDAMTTVGSIYTHDTHVEKILIAMLAVMSGGDKKQGVIAPLLERAGAFQEKMNGGGGGILQQGIAAVKDSMGSTGGLMGMMGEKIATSVAGWTIPTAAELAAGATSASVAGEETEVAKQTSFLSLISDGIATLTGGLTSTGEKAATGEEGTEGGLFGGFDSKAFGESITMFSLSANSLAEALNSPLKIEVGGKVNMTVKIEGDEAFAKLSGEFEKLAVEKINMGIKNFVKNMQRGDLTDANWAGGDNQPTLGGGAGNTA
jgi:TP901 family phage tail tape measure protein